MTDYHIEVEQKRLKRKVSELKFRITKVKQLSIQESVFPDIENLPSVAIELIQAEVDRNVALKIADEDWEFVSPEKLSPPGTYPDFLAYIAEKIEMSLQAASVKNRPGFIIEAIRENYQDPEIQKQRQQRAEKLKEKQLEDLTAEFRAKRANIIRQAVHADPALVEKPPPVSNPISSKNGSLNTTLSLRSIRKAAWSKQRLMASLLKNSVRNLLHPLSRRMKMKR